MEGRKYSFLDSVLINLDKGIRTVFSVQDSSMAPVPGTDLCELDSSKEHRLRSEGLMRVNHAGEVAAQALYHGQSLAARDPAVRETMAKSASEENDHLYWCEERLRELGGRTSLLNPFWYFGSFMIGVTAGIAGDRWSLGFIAETERQVVRHLEEHLNELPPDDARSRAILQRMKRDETHHATLAIETGAADLPEVIKVLMTAASKVMTTAAYWL